MIFCLSCSSRFEGGFKTLNSPLVSEIIFLFYCLLSPTRQQIYTHPRREHRKLVTMLVSHEISYGKKCKNAAKNLNCKIETRIHFPFVLKRDNQSKRVYRTPNDQRKKNAEKRNVN